jgi:aminopeptidase N
MAVEGLAGNIEGLSQFTRALARAGADGTRQEVKEANFRVADKLIDAAKDKASGLTRQQKAAAASMRATKTQNYAAVRLGSKRKAYALGAEFGSVRRTRTGRIARGFQEWRGNQFSGWSGGPGYFLHPTIREKGEQLIAEYRTSIDRMMAEAFPE